MNRNFKVGDKLIHKNLGPVEYTEACWCMDMFHNCDITSVHVCHDGDVKEVSLNLVRLYNDTN